MAGMRRTGGMLAAILAATMASALPVRADPMADAARKWGLIGAWKPDCGAPTTATNPAFIYSIRDGKLSQDRLVRNVLEPNQVSHAIILGDGSLETTTVFVSPSTVRVAVFRKIDENSFVVWSNRGVGEADYSIEDGKMVNGGQPMPTMHRCR